MILSPGSKWLVWFAGQQPLGKADFNATYGLVCELIELPRDVTKKFSLMLAERFALRCSVVL